MKNIYTTPVIKMTTVDIKDVITNSLTNGGDNGTVFSERKWNELDWH